MRENDVINTKKQLVRQKEHFFTLIVEALNHY